MSMFQISKASADFRIFKEFDSWRGLEFDETYTCAIELLPTARIMIELDIVKFSVTSEVAQEISACLKKALAISGGEGSYEAEFGNRPNGLFKTHSLAGMSARQYWANGEIAIEDASGDFFEGSSSGTTSIVVCTIQDGGYELVLPFMCYSFTQDDATWLSEGLLNASQKVATT
jgi:hypothetical protein